MENLDSFRKKTHSQNKQKNNSKKQPKRQANIY